MNKSSIPECVVGFMFNDKPTEVALILKRRPVWQFGKLNGIGGHVEQTESPLKAMVREFKEETGSDTQYVDWHCYAVITFPATKLFCYASRCGGAFGLCSTGSERIEITKVRSVYPLREDLVAHVPWLVSCAIGNLIDPDMYGIVNMTVDAI